MLLFISPFIPEISEVFDRQYYQGLELSPNHTQDSLCFLTHSTVSACGVGIYAGIKEKASAFFYFQSKEDKMKWITW